LTEAKRKLKLKNNTANSNKVKELKDKVEKRRKDVEANCEPLRVKAYIKALKT